MDLINTLIAFSPVAIAGAVALFVALYVLRDTPPEVMRAADVGQHALDDLQRQK